MEPALQSVLMSILIQMPQVDEEPQEQNMNQVLMQQLANLMQHPQFSNASIMREIDNSITISLLRGAFTFVRDTCWTLEIKKNQLRIWMVIVDQSGLNYMRAQSQRMKLELMILLRFINAKLPLQEEFFVEPVNGVLRYSFVILWKDYREKIKGAEALRKLFRYLLTQVNLYAEAMLFCEPRAPEVQTGQSMHSPPNGLEAINRYRFLMRGTRKFRESNIGIMDQVVQLKNQLKQSPTDPNMKRQLDQLRVLYQGNILAYEQMRVGLKDPEEQQLQGCLKYISQAAEGRESRKSDSNIVNGLKILRQIQTKSLSKQGSHSQIMKGRYIYKISKTINQFSTNDSIWLNGKQLKGELVFKRCNTQQQSSRNSFMNQIYLLNHIRDNQSSYIAKYYLPVKKFQERSQHDFIFMRPYFHNLYTIVRKLKTFSLAEKLSVAYKISKGLCFLSAKSVLHRDFKPQNIMMDQAFNPSIIDFGSCAPAFHENNFKVPEERLLTTRTFHVYYHEIPEELAYIRQKYSREEYNRHPLFDIYSFGKVLSFLFFGSLTPPNPEQLTSQPHPQMLKNILYIIMLSLQIDPDERPTFSEIRSFLGTLKSYFSSIPQTFQNKMRSMSQPKTASELPL